MARVKNVPRKEEITQGRENPAETAARRVAWVAGAAARQANSRAAKIGRLRTADAAGNLAQFIEEEMM